MIAEQPANDELTISRYFTVKRFYEGIETFRIRIKRYMYMTRYIQDAVRV